MRGRDHPELSGLVVLKRLNNFITCVHDEWPEPGDRFTDRFTAQDQHVQRRSARILPLRRLDDDAISCAVDGELTGLNSDGLSPSDRARALLAFRFIERGLLFLIALLTLGAVALATILYQGGMALYYYRRRAPIAAALERDQLDEADAT